jgi:fucose permease
MDYEDAERMTGAPLAERVSPVTREQIYRTIGYYAAFVILGLVGAALGPTLPDLAERTGSRLDEISFLFVTHSLGYLLGSFQGGRWYDPVPGHVGMAAALVVMAGMLLLTPAISALWVLVAVWLVLGLAVGAVDVGGNTLLVWVHGDRVGPFMNGLHFFFGVGSFLSPILISRVMLAGGGIGWAFGLLALLVLPVAVWLLRLPSPATVQAPRADGPARQVGWLPVALIGLLLFLYVGAEVGYGGWIYTYALGTGVRDEATAAYLVSVFWGALTVGRLLAVPVAHRFRPRTILLGGLVGCLLSLGIVWGNRVWGTWVGTVSLGLSMAAIFPTTIALAERHLRISGRVMGWLFVGSGAGGMFLPWIVGQFVEQVGPQAMLPIFVVDVVAALSVLIIILSRFDRLIGEGTGSQSH